jgi:hypothetical protein
MNRPWRFGGGSPRDGGVRPMSVDLREPYRTASRARASAIAGK